MDFPYEFTKPLLLCFKILNQCNVGFFDENVSFLRKYWRSFYIVPIVVVNYISMTFYMSRIFTTNVNILELAYMVSVYLIMTQDFLKVAILLPKKADITKLITELGKMWRTDNLTDIQIEKKSKLMKRLNFSNGVYYWSSMIAAWQNIAGPFFITLFRKLFLNQDYDFLLALGCVYPFDPVKNWYRYIVVYIFQFYAAFRVAYYYIGTEMLMIALCAQITTEFTLLREDLKRIKPKENSSEVIRFVDADKTQPSDNIKNFIRRHQHLIELSNLLNRIFNKMVFIDLLFATAILCFFTFGASVASGAVEITNNFIAIFALLFPVFILCYYAEMLQKESTGIAHSAYENLWYVGDLEYQRTIRFIIRRAQLPCYLSSLKYAPVSLNTFTKVVSTTWSYFSLARSILDEN